MAKLFSAGPESKYAVEELDKQIHDKNLVRILKCSQLHASGYMINPISKHAYLCSDVINIRSYVKANPDLFNTKK